MWDPGFPHIGVASARVLGWHRRFSLLSTQSWGTAAKPGLCAVLHRGGTSWGRVFAVEPGQIEMTLERLDRREAAYLRRNVWLDIIDDGGIDRRRAITYVANPDHPRLRANLHPDEQAALVRQGQGRNGSSLGYLQRTAECLADDSHFRTDAHRFLAKIKG